jgi:hypothetical protein
MPDDKQPPERPTAKLAQGEIQTELLNKLLSSVSALGEKVDSCIGAVSTVTNEVATMKVTVAAVQVELGDIREWKGGINARLDTNSMRAAAVSKTDMTQDAAISTIVTDVGTLKNDVAAVKADLATNTLVTGQIKKLLEDPVVKKLGWACATAALALLSYVTAYFQTKGHP